MLVFSRARWVERVAERVFMRWSLASWSCAGSAWVARSWSVAAAAFSCCCEGGLAGLEISQR